jgi:hypothetical protein
LIDEILVRKKNNGAISSPVLYYAERCRVSEGRGDLFAGFSNRRNQEDSFKGYSAVIVSLYQPSLNLWFPAPKKIIFCFVCIELLCNCA